MADAAGRDVLSIGTKGPVAYLGPEGSFSHQAALSLFGETFSLLPCNGIEMVFRELESGGCEMGMLPVENSVEGVVTQALDRLVRSEVPICAEHLLPIEHCLLSNHPLQEIERVHSHPQALAQCRDWLDENLPDAERMEAASTAAAARITRDEESSAAIASAAAADIHSLPILSRNIGDRGGGVTRFLVLGGESPPASGDDKTSICFSLLDRPGALHDALLSLKEEGVSMSMIQSRPARGRSWEYLFFVDLIGHRGEASLSRALDSLKVGCARMRVLGSYPRAQR